MTMKWREATFLAMMLGGFLAVPPPAAFSQAESGAAPDGCRGILSEVHRFRGVSEGEGAPRKGAGGRVPVAGRNRASGEEYRKALSHDRGFTAEDRLMMARHMSWGGRIDEAIEELRAILSEDPGNIDARNHLARCLSWKGDLGGSLEESSRVLAASPGNKDALLTRANALRWSRQPERGHPDLQGHPRKRGGFRHPGGALAGVPFLGIREGGEGRGGAAGARVPLSGKRAQPVERGDRKCDPPQHGGGIQPLPRHG